jgi:hypothetical protein
MTPEKKKELIDGFAVNSQNLNKIVEGILCAYFGDGNSQEDAKMQIVATLEFGSYHMQRDLEALDRLLNEPGRDQYLIKLVGDIVGAYLPSYDPDSCRAWVQQKTAMIREIFEQAVKERGGHF